APGGLDVRTGVADRLARGADVVGQVGDCFGVDLGFGEGGREDLFAVGVVDEQFGFFVGGQVGGGGGVQAVGRGWLGGQRGELFRGHPTFFRGGGVLRGHGSLYRYKVTGRAGPWSLGWREKCPTTVFSGCVTGVVEVWWKEGVSRSRAKTFVRASKGAAGPGRGSGAGPVPGGEQCH